MRRIDQIGRQCLREGSWIYNPQFPQCAIYSGGNQGRAAGMSFNDGLRSLNAKFDYIILSVKLNNLIHLIEQYRSVDVLNSNHLVCDLCGGYHATYQCVQAQHVDQCDEFGHYNSYFDKYGPNCYNFSDHGWDNQGAYNDSL